MLRAVAGYCDGDGASAVAPRYQGGDLGRSADIDVGDGAAGLEGLESASLGIEGRLFERRALDAAAAAASRRPYESSIVGVGGLQL